MQIKHSFLPASFATNNCLVLVILTLFLSTSPCLMAKKANPIPLVNTSISTQDRNKFNYYFYEALKQKELGKYDQAIDLLTKCYYINPKSAIVFYEFAKIYGNIQDTPNAIKYMLLATQLDRTNSWYKLGLAEMCVKNNDYKNAIAIYRDISKNHPEADDVDFMLASLYKQTNNPQESINSLDRVERKMGINENLAFEKYRLYSDMGKRKKANAEIDKLVKRYPTNYRYSIIRAGIYAQDKEDKKALKTFEWVKQKDPNNIFLYQSMHEYYKSKGDSVKAYNLLEEAFINKQIAIEDKMETLTQFMTVENQSAKKAEEYFKVLIDIYPTNEMIRTYYATFLLMQRRYDEAIPELQFMLELNPNNRDGWLELIKAYLDQEKDQESNVVIVIDEALKNLPEEANLYYYKGLYLQKKGEFMQALEVYKKGLKYVQDDDTNNKANFNMQIADLYATNEQLDSAFVYYEQGYKINPNNALLLNNYAYYLSVVNKDLAKAESMSAKTIQAFPDNVSFLDTYAWIFFKQGNMVFAKMYLEQALDKGGNENEVVLEHYGDVLYLSNLKDEALRMWKEAQSKGNKSEILKQKIETQTYIPEHK